MISPARSRRCITPAAAEQDGHGVGVADIDGDGLADILTPNGWLKQVDANKNDWEWHPDWQMGDAGFPIIGYDVNNDGKMDVIYGQGHSYGLYWLEQIGDGDNRHWVRRAIDESFSQVHALKLVDIDGDGEPELLAGKRYRGHNGNDPGSYDPLVIYYYKIDRKTGSFSRYPISVNGTAGAGTQFVTEDLDKDGDIDIVVAGKTGVHFLENLQGQQGFEGAAREGTSPGQELAISWRRARGKTGGSTQALRISNAQKLSGLDRFRSLRIAPNWVRKAWVTIAISEFRTEISTDK